ncbi:MAG: DegV family protein [Oscillospiraceae bacterium]|nr:DegV family protein [Oscillospiraceae bacterium]
MSVKIISDSTCDLSPALIEKYGVRIMPLHIVLDDKEYEDGLSITPDEIYKWSDEHNATPKTSALNMEYAVDVFRPILEAGDEIICFSISGEMSTTVNVMRLAAEELNAEDRVFVIDSRNLSTGIGLQVIEAAIMAAEGKSGAEIAAHIADIQPRVRASFVIDTLKFLHRGGRCSGMAAFAGTALKLHPKIVVADGKMAPTKKYMGGIGRVVMSYVKDMEAELKNAETDRVFITHSGCSEALIADVRSYLEELGIFKEILETRAGCVVSSHCGPNTLGVLFIEKA